MDQPLDKNCRIDEGKLAPWVPAFAGMTMFEVKCTPRDVETLICRPRKGIVACIIEIHRNSAKHEKKGGFGISRHGNPHVRASDLHFLEL
jgi:hypothetical protein